MKTKSIQSPGIGPIVMIGAGLCTALLFTVARQGTFQSMALGHVTPLPIMISALGFGPAIGFGSAGIAAITVVLLSALHGGTLSGESLLTGLILAAVFAVILALPSWWLSFLACLARLETASRWKTAPPDKKNKQLTFYPIGHILVHAAIIALVLVGLGAGMVVFGYGTFDDAFESLTVELMPFVQKLVDVRPELSSFDVHALTQMTLRTMPSVLSGWILLTFAGNLWLAGRIVQTSNNLRRPWPNIPYELRIPRPFAVVLAAACALCFVKNWPGMIGLTAAVTFALIYALQGIAVIHDLSRGLKWRTLMLFVIYATLVFIPWPLALFAVIGLADTVFSLRDRKAAALLAAKT